MRGSRNLLWLVPLLLLLGWPLYGAGVVSFLTPPEIRESEELRARQEQGQRFNMETVRFFQEIDGALQWRIDSRELRAGEREQELLLRQVTAVLHRDGNEQMWIDARRGRYDTERELLELEDEVYLRDADGFELQTQALSYHEGEGRVSSRVGVEISADDLRARGRRLDYFLADGRYELTGQVEFLAP